MSNSGLSVINLPECLYELLNIPLQKSSRKTRQVELQRLPYHAYKMFIAAIGFDYRSFGKFINSLEIKVVKLVKHILHLLTFKSQPSLVKQEAEVIRCVKAHGEANSQRRGGMGERGSESIWLQTAT